MMFRRVREAMAGAAARGVFPGGVALAACRGAVVFEEGFGRARLPDGPPVTPDTLFDLASLTKPLATAMACMTLTDEGALGPDTPLGSLAPVFSGTDKAPLTVARLLGHSAGFPAWRPYYRELVLLPLEARKARLGELLVREPLEYAPGTATVYSDLGYMALWLGIEALTGVPFDRFVRSRVFGPLGARDVFFPPEKGPGAPPGRISAATENCPVRGRVVEGKVHDLNCHALGGVCGHAGLFGTARGVGRLARALLAAAHGRAAGPFSAETVRMFWTSRPGPGSHVLGFDTPTRPGSSSGRYFSDGSVGHLGFTGTSLWIDPEREVVMALLTNRVHLGAENGEIRVFRPEFHDAAWEDMAEAGLLTI
jgi:CubicO group peptidase (beta-lactamase class C family)